MYICDYYLFVGWLVSDVSVTCDGWLARFLLLVVLCAFTTTESLDHLRFDVDEVIKFHKQGR